MKRLLFLIVIFCAIKANSQTYLISFAGMGAADIVGSVKVENLTSGTTLTMNGSEILRLGFVTGFDKVEDNQLSGLKIYPNPVTDKSTLEIYPPVAGDATMSVYDMTGRLLALNKCFLENSLQQFSLSGIKSGFYLISVTGKTFQYSGKVLSNGTSDGQMTIEKIAAYPKTAGLIPGKVSRSMEAIVDMNYSPGDRIMFTGISGIYRTVKTEILSSDKTITFNFIGCTDGDNNNYPVVSVGNQIWMAENLKTTKYNDGSDIPNIAIGTEWDALITPGYCWNNNDAATAKTTYGALYNWYTVSATGNADKNICPTGWHLPTDAEWTILTTYLGGESDAGGKLKETGTTHWQDPNTGNTNETGFTALPGGNRLFGGGTFQYFGSNGFWWSSTLNIGNYAWFRMMDFSERNVIRNYDNVQNGNSVRCLFGLTRLVTTTTPALITQNSATSGGNIMSDGTETSSVRGVCWSTSTNPTILDNKTSDGTGPGTFTSSITGLKTNTRYYLRAYATYSSGTEYGSEIFFSTRGEEGTVTDIDGNTYSTIQIGTQVWLAENLKTTKYNDGTNIPNVMDNTAWAALVTPAYCWYNNDAANYKDSFGALYNWYTLDRSRNGAKNICPAGWHVNSNAELTSMITYLGGDLVAGGKLKEVGIAHWIVPNTGATNESGFSALPGGERDLDGTFSGIMASDTWWTSTPNDSANFWYWAVSYNGGTIGAGYDPAQRGFSVRCLKDN
jgi:uncharacterized protein (TIGR02145 family)